MIYPTEIKCTLCGFEFFYNEASCVKCPLNKQCKIICCPHCGYQTIDESKIKHYGNLIFKGYNEVKRGLKWLRKTMSMKRF